MPIRKIPGAGSEPDLFEPTLHYGNSRVPLARVVPDDRYPGMWRIAWPDGRLSDMVNLARAKDAAAAIAERGPPRLDPRLFRWLARESAPAAPPIRSSGGRAAE